MILTLNIFSRSIADMYQNLASLTAKFASYNHPP